MSESSTNDHTRQPDRGFRHITEFSRAADLYQKWSLIASVGPLLIAFACIVAYVPFQHRFEAFLMPRMQAWAVDTLTVMPMGLPFLLGLLLMIPLLRRVERRLAIACPHCAKPLGEHKPIVIASRNCPYCGQR